LFVIGREPFDRLGRRSIEKIFNRLGKCAGIDRKVYPHIMRHTTATTILQSGANIIEVQEYLGHCSTVTTQIYAKIDRESVRQSVRRHLV